MTTGLQARRRWRRGNQHTPCHPSGGAPDPQQPAGRRQEHLIDGDAPHQFLR
ncbi:MAG: hypothetical protein KGQ16_00535 [Cyanobacteria bacterium REEB444]|nr:hypothetical protein [Cyanobacteria bacterium REEB444]